MGRWDHVEDAPDYAAALIAAGLPVASCDRQTHPPHHVRTRWHRKLTLDQKVLAQKVRDAVRAGTFKVEPPRPSPSPAPTEHFELPALAKPTGRPGVPVRTTNIASPSEAVGIRNLACELIRLAFEDARTVAKEGHGPRALDIEQARLFLTARSGDWAKARELWCAVADLDPDAIREAALRHLSDGGEIKFPPNAGPRARGL